MGSTDRPAEQRHASPPRAGTSRAPSLDAVSCSANSAAALGEALAGAIAASARVRDTVRQILATPDADPTPLREAVQAYTRALRASGAAPECVLVAVKGAVGSVTGDANSWRSARTSDHLLRAGMLDRAVTWCIEAYYRR